ncbi:MAG: glycosyltransferase family 39 protein, partial [Phycisphaerales bacterium]|nr:glycosyltransferase family 39 protein [Phycisphaerales bacterium]
MIERDGAGGQSSECVNPSEATAYEVECPGPSDGAGAKSPSQCRMVMVPAKSLSNIWFFALLGWVCVMSFAGLLGGAEFEPTDCWVAQTAREMRDSGKWLIPVFSGETRMQKSPGPYWAVMLAAWLRGTPIDEAAARAPNAIAGVIMVGVIFWLTRRIAGDRAAVFAGFASSASVLLLYWTHRGASDFGLATLITVSLAALWVATADEKLGVKRGMLWVLGYFAAGLGMLYKMPMPLALIGLPAFVYILITRRWSAFLSGWHLVGVFAFLLPWLPWAIAAMLSEPAALAKWKVEFLDRFTGDLPNVEGQRNLPW